MINAKLMQLVINASNDGIVVAEREGKGQAADLRQPGVRTADRLHAG
ncbi:hypothetical protein OKW09_003880 [Pseudomonas rhodesiae]|nr:hypothetical protein [Pseudomonas rhodesiae]